MLISHLTAACNTITYNHLNLPVTVSGTPAASYTYDAGGRKLRSVNAGVATDYIGGIEWEGGTLNVIRIACPALGGRGGAHPAGRGV